MARPSVSERWLLQLLERVRSGELPLDEATKELSVLPYEELGCAKLDHHRSLRVGFPEVILGRGKTIEQVVTIAEHLAARLDKVLVTHATEEAYTAVQKKVPDAAYNPVARTIVVNRDKGTIPHPGITVVTAGTADIPVAEEATVTRAKERCR